MGNTPPTPSSLRLVNGDLSSQVQLGRSARINFGGREVKQYLLSPANVSRIVESWQLAYEVGKSTFVVYLTKIKNNDSSFLGIEIRDYAYGVPRYYFHADVTLENAEAGLLDSSMLDPEEEKKGTWATMHMNKMLSVDTENFASSTTNAGGGITNTSFYFYGCGTRLDLILVEWKRKRRDEKPYAGMVAHYYANTESGEDVGLSVALKRIGMSGDGHLDFSVDGPEQHPVAELHYMFDRVRRTRTWKPSYCPHCADKIIQRQHADIWQSGSSDSDVDDVPVAPQPSHGQNARGLLANDGGFKGNDNRRADIWQSGSADSGVDTVPVALLPSRGQNARGRFKGNNNRRADIWQSGSTDSGVDTVPVALLPSRGQNARGLLANDGRFKGNNNGNLNIKNLILGRRRR